MQDLTAEGETVCVYWNHSGRTSHWSPDGCQVVRSNHTHTTCGCHHLSSFAVLISTNKVKAQGRCKVCPTADYHRLGSHRIGRDTGLVGCSAMASCQMEKINVAPNNPILSIVGAIFISSVTGSLLVCFPSSGGRGQRGLPIRRDYQVRHHDRGPWAETIDPGRPADQGAVLSFQNTAVLVPSSHRAVLTLIH